MFNQAYLYITVRKKSKNKHNKKVLSQTYQKRHFQVLIQQKFISTEPLNLLNKRRTFSQKIYIKNYAGRGTIIFIKVLHRSTLPQKINKYIIKVGRSLLVKKIKEKNKFLIHTLLFCHKNTSQWTLFLKVRRWIFYYNSIKTVNRMLNIKI